jgi:hypothetical protein
MLKQQWTIEEISIFSNNILEKKQPIRTLSKKYVVLIGEFWSMSTKFVLVCFMTV